MEKKWAVAEQIKRCASGDIKKKSSNIDTIVNQGAHSIVKFELGH